MCALCGYNRVGNENEPEQTLGPLLLSVKEGNDMGVGKRGACTPDQVRSAEKGKTTSYNRPAQTVGPRLRDLTPSQHKLQFTQQWVCLIEHPCVRLGVIVLKVVERWNCTQTLELYSKLDVGIVLKSSRTLAFLVTDKQGQLVNVNVHR